MPLPSPSKPSGERVVSWLLLVVSVALAVLATRRPVGAGSPAGTGQDPLALVPAGPRLLLTAEVAELTRVAGSDMLRAGGDRLLGLRELCGFEPLLRLERVVFAMPGGSHGGHGSDFALIAKTTLDPDQALGCAELVIRQRGGSPARSTLGKFTSIRDLGKPLGEVAIRPDGMFVLSGGRYFRDVMDAAQARATPDQARLLRSQLHRKLRDELGPAQLKLTMLGDSAPPLPGIDALGLSLQVEQELRLHGRAYCSSAEACAQAREVIAQTAAELGREPELSGLTGLSMDERPGQLELAARLPREQLGALLLQLVAP
jgi:hypothetical protein